MADSPALRRTLPFDLERGWDGLRDGAFTSHEVAAARIELAVEPLLRRGAAGLEQPIRVRSSRRLSRAVITVAGGIRIEADAEGHGGDVRFFLPALDEPTSIQLQFPELDADVIDLTVHPVRPWHVSLVPHSHFDIGYTDLQGRVITEQLAYLDDALRLAEAGAGATASAFRWSVESIWVLREWIARRRPETIERFMAQVRAGTIEVAALPFNVHTEACSTEELHGLLRHARDISERFDIELPLAYQTDIPGCVAGLVDALAGAGVKYLAVAHNWAGRSVPYLGEGLHLPRMFRWASPAGNSVLVWMTTSAQGIAYQEGAVLGFNDGIERVDDLLPLFLLNEQTRPFPYDHNSFGFALADREFDRAPYPWNEIHLRVTGRIGDNAPPNRRLGEVVEAWNERWEYPRLEITRTQDFFEHMEATHADRIETFTGDWNNWWADGVGSGARHLQLNRGAQHALSQAASVNAMLGGDGVPGFATRLDTAWGAVELFDEHTWGAAYPWTTGDSAHASGADQWHWKAEKALRAEQEALLLTQEALRAFAERSGGGGSASIWIVNTDGRPRGGVVSAFLPESLVHTTSVITVVDPDTGAVVPFSERNQANPAHRDAGRYVEFVIDSVPAFGSRRLDIVVVDGQRPAALDGTVSTGIGAVDPIWHLENGHLSVHVDPRSGAITSIHDLGSGRQLVNSGSAFGFNAYVHDRLATRGQFNHLSGFIADGGPDLALLADRTTTAHVAFEDAGSDALGSWIRFRTFGVGVEAIITTLRLGRGADVVDITNRVIKPYTTDKESGFFAFPFAVDEPVVRFEVSGSVAGSDIPLVPGGAPYMHAVRDWVTLYSGDRAATLVTQDAPLIQVGDIALPFAPFPGTLKSREPGTVFSWIHNNVWDTNWPSGQAFDMVFRYRVGGLHATDAEAAGVASADLARDLVRPLLAVAADPAGGPGESRSVLEIADSRIRLLGVDRTSRGTLLAKLQSLAAAEVTFDVTVSAPIRDAWSASLIAVRGERLDVIGGRTVTVTLGGFGTGAVELDVDPRAERSDEL